MNVERNTEDMFYEADLETIEYVLKDAILYGGSKVEVLADLSRRLTEFHIFNEVVNGKVIHSCFFDLIVDKMFSGYASIFVQSYHMEKYYLVRNRERRGI